MEGRWEAGEYGLNSLREGIEFSERESLLAGGVSTEIRVETGGVSDS